MSKLTSANGLKPRVAIALAFTTLATGFLAAACSGDGTEGNATSGNTVKIVSSLPMTGSSLGQTQTMINGIQQALD
ncbi:MAG: branched-chain amino acid ABC transporter substrate-binding protein, partial [Coleofasciculus sp. S288]|nr:branched-chain amino acid ABC transporter substrate-binding protein [Coleofasciculus sp. S288]